MSRKKRALAWRVAACAAAFWCVATLAAGAWSWHRYITLALVVGRPVSLCFASGLVAVDNYDRYEPFEVQPDPNASFMFWPPLLSSGNRWVIWEPDTRADGTRYTHWYTRAPLWMPALAFALAATYLEHRARRLYSWSASRCGACGYDLAGLKTNRCPECGSLISPE